MSRPGAGDALDAHVAAHGQAAGFAARASVVTAIFLLILKAVAARQTGSVAMLGSLADSALDLVASLVTLFGIAYAARPADDDHAYGHGKAEALAALFQVMLIVASGIGIGARAIMELGSGQPTRDPALGIGVSLVAMVATFALTRVQTAALRRADSLAVRADRLHYLSDFALNGAVVVALALDSYAGLRGADEMFGVGIALWLLWGAWTSATRAIDQLMDRQWHPDEQAAFLRVAARHPELQGIHDFRTRTSGNRHFVQFNLWVDGSQTLDKVHAMMDELEHMLADQFPGTEIMIHPEPRSGRGDAA